MGRPTPSLQCASNESLCSTSSDLGRISRRRERALADAARRHFLLGRSPGGVDGTRSLFRAKNGAVRPGYIQWLEAYDPDIIYSYVDLNHATVERSPRI
jgi:hypothetical protein